MNFDEFLGVIASGMGTRLLYYSSDLGGKSEPGPSVFIVEDMYFQLCLVLPSLSSFSCIRNLLST